MSEASTAEAPATEAPEAEEATTSTEAFDQDRALAKIKKANDEARSLRTRIKELEAFESKIKELEDSQKSEAQKVQERAQKAEQDAAEARSELARERIARRYKIDDEDLELLGTGTEEQLEARAKRIAALNAAAAKIAAVAPPSEKPVEKLRPGVTGADASLAPPDAYPSSWRTAKTAQTRKE